MSIQHTVTIFLIYRRRTMLDQSLEASREKMIVLRADKRHKDYDASSFYHKHLIMVGPTVLKLRLRSCE